MTHFLLAGCALLAIAGPAVAQQHDHGAMPMPAPAPAPAPPSTAPDSCTMTVAGDGTVACNPGNPTTAMDHANMDHATPMQGPVPPMEAP